MPAKYELDGVGIQLVSGAPAGSVGAIQIVTEPSLFFTIRPEASCCDPSCVTGWIGPHFRSTGPPGLTRSPIGPGAPFLPWIGTWAAESGCFQVFETLNEYVVGLPCAVGVVAT